MAERKDDPDFHYVYVVQIAPKWAKLVRPSLEEDSELLYVGESQHLPTERFERHRLGHGFATKGGEASARPFRKIRAARERAELTGTLVDEDAWLRRDLMEDLKPVIGRTSGETLEMATAESLRAEGYFVLGPKPPKARRRKRRKSKVSGAHRG